MLENINGSEASMHQKYLKSIGTQILTNLSKMETRFKADMGFMKGPSLEFALSKITPMLDAYEVVSFQMCETCYAVDAIEFGDSIAKIFRNISSFIKIILTSVLESPSKEQKNKKKGEKFIKIVENDESYRTRQINSFYLKECIRSMKSMKEVKELEEYENQEDQLSMNYEKLKQEKEKAMKTNSSNVNYILNETVNSFQKKYEYLQKFISIRENYEEVIRYDNTVTQQAKLQSELNIKCSKAIQKLKQIFMRFEKRIHNQKNEKFSESKEQINELLIKSEKKEKSIQRLEMKISRLKEDIKKKNVEVESLKKKMELKQAEIQTINKMKQEQIENLIHEQQMSARKQRQKSRTKIKSIVKVMIDQQVECNMQVQIIKKRKKLLIRKQTLMSNKNITNEQKLKLNSNVINLSFSDEEDQLSSNEIKEKIKRNILNKSKRSTLKPLSSIQPIEAKNKLKMNKESKESIKMSMKMIMNMNNTNNKNYQETQRGQMKKNQKSSSSIKVLKSQRTIKFKEVQRESSVKIKIPENAKIHISMISHFHPTQILLQDLFGSLENTKNYEHLKIIKYVHNKKHHKYTSHKDIIDSTKNSPSLASQIDFSEKQSHLIESIWKNMKAIKMKKQQLFTRVSMFFKYPYSSVTRCKQKGWVENVKYEPDVAKEQVTNFISKVLKLHHNCPKMQESTLICSHILDFISILGLEYTNQQQQ